MNKQTLTTATLSILIIALIVFLAKVIMEDNQLTGRMQAEANKMGCTYLGWIKHVRHVAVMDCSGVVINKYVP